MAELTGLPAYEQIADDLRQTIRRGELAPGDRLPSATELMKQYRVSSTVIKAALTQLRGEGLVIGQQGKGVFVRDPEAATTRPSTTFTAITRELDAIQANLNQLGERVAELESQVLTHERGKPQRQRPADQRASRPAPRDSST